MVLIDHESYDDVLLCCRYIEFDPNFSPLLEVTIQIRGFSQKILIDGSQVD